MTHCLMPCVVLQAVLVAIVLLSYYGNEGGRLFFGLVDYLGVGIAVGFSIVIPLIFLSYLCDGNILIFVSGNYKYSLSHTIYNIFLSTRFTKM